MSLSIKAERSLTTQDEFEFLAQTHMPGLLGLEDGALSAAQRRLRDLRAKERTLAREMRRGIRGKGEPRGSSFPGNIEKPSRRKQIFASALKRLNGEIARRRSRAARDALKASARRALQLKTNAARRHRRLAPGRSSGAGMRPIESERPRMEVNPAMVGRVSQATKTAQAAKDTRSQDE
ncbi:hypothetical protein [Methylobacterium sp. ID0610]|uniref:hypothetical protein n=1 Tax=Methylobacterium carpenticola TaxID=3344827 RepID=UPI00368CFF90